VHNQERTSWRRRRDLGRGCPSKAQDRLPGQTPLGGKLANSLPTPRQAIASEDLASRRVGLPSPRTSPWQSPAPAAQQRGPSVPPWLLTRYSPARRRLGVPVAGRLIQEQEVGPLQQRLALGDAPPFAAGKRGRLRLAGRTRPEARPQAYDRASVATPRQRRPGAVATN
jgi:hypothetical protein